MNRKEAIGIISRYAPCPHDSANTSLGDGKTWAQCEDCGETFSQKNWPRYKQTFEDFLSALDYLSKDVYQIKCDLEK